MADRSADRAEGARDADPAPGLGDRGRPRRETPAEARARRGAIEDPGMVLAAAARLLESRHRTVHEVRQRLTEGGYRPDLVAGTIVRLADLGYLDDGAFARAWVASRDRAHPRGERALRSELARKGVAREIVDEVLAERATDAAASGEAGGDGPAALADAADEAAAEHLLERRRAALERVADPRTRRQRAYALLARSGFDPGTCAEVAARFVAATTEG